MFGATGSPLAQRLLGLINRNSSRSDKPKKHLWLGAFVALLTMACLVSCSQATKPSPTLSSSLGQSDTSLLEEVPNAPDLRVLIWEWQGCDTCTADLRLNFDQSLDAFRESSGKKVELAVVDPMDYSLRLNTSLQSEPYAHLIWISQEMLPGLVEEGRILPLDEFYAAHPEVATDLPEASLARFRLNGQLYGIPLGPAEEWNWNAYAITRQSMEAGKAELAFELLSFLRARVPPHGLPELIIERLLSEPENPSMGEPFEFIAAIRNAGEANAENVVVAFYTPNGDLIGEQVVDFIEPGAVEFTSVQAVCNQSDLAWFHVEIDPQRIIPETNKRNNSGYFPFGTGPGAPSTPVAASQPFCIDSKAYQSSYNGMSPKVAFDGTNYLVIWAKQQSPFTGTYAHQIYGARVSSSGTVIDTNGFVIASKVGKYDSFNLAFDGTNYLVVWELEKSGVGSYTAVDPATILYGARVSKAGKVLDSTPFVIEQGTTPASEYSQFWHRWPVVIYTGSDFMVIYYTSTEDGSGHSKDHTEDGVYARRVSKAGVVGSKQ